MDKLDRMLKHLPRQAPAHDLAQRIRTRVRRRHTRRVWARRGLGTTFALVGLVMAWPGLSTLPTGWLTPGAPWLMQSMDLFWTGSPQEAAHLWDGIFSIRSSLSSSLGFSAGLGIALITLGLFFGLDRRVFQPPLHDGIMDI